MKIGLVVPGGVDRSGTDRVIPCVLWMIERFAEQAEVHVFALRQEPKPAKYALLGACIHNIGARPRRARAIAAIAAEHRRGAFDVLHALWAAPEGVIAGLTGKLLNVPAVVAIAGGELADIPDIKYGMRQTARGRAWLSIAIANASRVTVPSAATQAQAAALNIATEVVPLGVAQDRWPALAPRSRRAGETARLLHVASLNQVKDQRTLLLAIRELVRQGVSLHLDVIGEDTLNGEIQSFAAELELQDHVTFHGFMQHTGMRPFFERAHLLLVTSRHETGPLVVLEAAVAGVPTVGTAVGHIADWNGSTSVAVPVGDIAALARETKARLDDDDRRVRMALVAQKCALSFDADWTAQQYLRMFRELSNCVPSGVLAARTAGVVR